MTGLVRIKSPWMQLGVLIAVFSPQIILLVISLFMTEKVNIDISTPQAITSLKMEQAFYSAAFFLLPAFLYAVFCFRSRYGHYLGLKPAELPNMYVFAVVVIIFSFPIAFWLGMVNEKINLPDWMERMESDTSAQLEAILKVNSPADLILNLAVIALIPAFCEEIFFRGALQRVLIHITKSPWPGIILSAVIFSALHLEFHGFFPRLFMGVVLGVLYWYSGSLWTCIIAHFVYNAVQVVAVAYLPKLQSNDPQVPVMAAVTSAIAVAAILFYYRRQSTITYSKVYRAEDFEPYKDFPS